MNELDQLVIEICKFGNYQTSDIAREVSKFTTSEKKLLRNQAAFILDSNESNREKLEIALIISKLLSDFDY